MKEQEAILAVLYGGLKIKTVSLPFMKERKAKAIKVDKREVEFEKFGEEIQFANTLILEKGNHLTILYE
ncbi:hypothetical protein KEJ19_01495 [Candidatus Bathyarchaeota archaeon]|nr:hypothetical protein [Candidatus Bathyarchaeota archaeon]